MTTGPSTQQQAPPAAPTRQQSPSRSIIERIEAAAQLLTERALTFTDAQETAFLEKFAEIVELYEAEYPGETPPLVRYTKDNVLQVAWPEGFSAKRLADVKRRHALAEIAPGALTS